MLDPLLMTFLTVADCGSFTKASKRLFISSTAVMKQMDALEAKLGLRLLERTPHGVQLTPAGNVIHRDARSLEDYAQRSLESARAAMADFDTTFCVGTSMLNPAKPFMDLWYQVNREFPGYKLHLVPFEDDHRGILGEIGQLGEKFDFLVGVCDSRAWLEQCRFLQLGTYKKWWPYRGSTSGRKEAADALRPVRPDLDDGKRRGLGPQRPDAGGPAGQPSQNPNRGYPAVLRHFGIQPLR